MSNTPIMKLVALLVICVHQVAGHSIAASSRTSTTGRRGVRLIHLSHLDVVQQLRALDAQNISIRGGSTSSAGLFETTAIGAAPLRGGLYILSSVPNANPPNIVSRQAAQEFGSEEISLNFSVVPTASSLKFEFLYFLSGLAPSDFDISRALTIEVDGTSCREHGNVEAHPTAVDVTGIKELHLRTSQILVTCTTTVIPGEKVSVKVIARDVIINGDKISSAVLLVPGNSSLA